MFEDVINYRYSNTDYRMLNNDMHSLFTDVTEMYEGAHLEVEELGAGLTFIYRIKIGEDEIQSVDMTYWYKTAYVVLTDTYGQILASLHNPSPSEVVKVCRGIVSPSLTPVSKELQLV